MASVMNIKRCGGCKYAKMVVQDLSKRVCWGAPPTAIQTIVGNKGTLSMVRPVVSVSDDACALFAPKGEAELERDERDAATLREMEPRQ